MLATNKEIRSKEDVIRVARIYFSRWKIEEYFRWKKQMFRFENFRVRKLHAINALNFYITVCMAFLAMISMDSESNAFKTAIIKTANPVKEKVFFCYYRLAKGISGILSYAKESVRLWFRTKRPQYRQLCLKMDTWQKIFISARHQLPRMFLWYLKYIYNPRKICLQNFFYFISISVPLFITFCGNSRNICMFCYAHI